MQLDTALLGVLPAGGNGLVAVCLVYDLGDKLWSIVDSGRVGSRQLCTRNCFLVAIHHEQQQQCPHTSYQKPKYDQLADANNDKAFSHLERVECKASGEASSESFVSVRVSERSGAG
jgi:hypothetical protein